MAEDQTVQTIAEGKHIRFVRRGSWEYVTRKQVSGIVGIVAVTEDGKLLLIEQARPALGKNVIELPAGLAGDAEGHAQGVLAAGYEAGEMEQVTEGTASAGITDEIISIFYARNLRKVGNGEGDGSEQITLHEVPLPKVVTWLNEQQRAGKLVDLKVYVGLYFANCLGTGAKTQ